METYPLCIEVPEDQFRQGQKTLVSLQAVPEVYVVMRLGNI